MVWVPIFMVVHSTQVYILLKPLFSRHKGIGVQFTDEPTGNLDTENGKVVIDLLKKLVQDENYCVIVVTHDPGIAAQADVVYKMQDGRLAVEC